PTTRQPATRDGRRKDLLPPRQVGPVLREHLNPVRRLARHRIRDRPPKRSLIVIRERLRQPTNRRLLTNRPTIPQHRQLKKLVALTVNINPNPRRNIQRLRRQRHNHNNTTPGTGDGKRVAPSFEYSR